MQTSNVLMAESSEQSDIQANHPELYLHATGKQGIGRYAAMPLTREEQEVCDMATD